MYNVYNIDVYCIYIHYMVLYIAFMYTVYGIVYNIDEYFI